MYMCEWKEEGEGEGEEEDEEGEWEEEVIKHWWSGKFGYVSLIRLDDMTLCLSRHHLTVWN